MDQEIKAQPLSTGKIIPDGSAYLPILPADSTYISHSTTGESLDARILGVNTVIGGLGNDTLVAAPQGSWLVGGGGSNHYLGQEGDDVFVISAHDNPDNIHGGAGVNTVIITGDEGVMLNNRENNIQLVYGGQGDDVIEVGDEKSFIDGGGGENTVILHGNYADYHMVQTADKLLLTDTWPNRDGDITLENIRQIEFADFPYFNISSFPYLIPVADNLRYDQAGQAFTRLSSHLIAPSQLLKNDHALNNPSSLCIKAINDPIGGNVSLTASGDILFVPDPDFMGIMQFKYSLSNIDGALPITLFSSITGENDIPLQAVVSLLTPELPFDPLLTQQWYLSAAHILPVWQDYTGKGIRIGQFEPPEPRIVHSSMDLRHSDLVPNIDPIWQASLTAKGTVPKIFCEHATNTASVMVAAKNEHGMVGVAYEAMLASYVTASPKGVLFELAAMLNSDIANHSWGYEEDAWATSHLDKDTDRSLLHAHMQYVVSNGRGGRGVVMVTGAGNGHVKGGSSQGCTFSNTRFTIQVGATHSPAALSTLNLKMEQFSNPGASVLLSAPGNAMLMASNTRFTQQGRVGDGFIVKSGTSFAVPIVSGVVALMLEANPNLGYRDVQKILALTARRVDNTYTTSTTWEENGASNWNGGGMHTSYTYGFGSIDARAAVRLAETWLEQNTASNEVVLTPLHPVKNTQANRSTLSISGALNIEHVEIDVGIHFTQLKDANLTLISPSGTQSTLLYKEEGALADSLYYPFMSTRHWAEPAQGEWVLEVSSLNDSQPVTLQQWALRLYGKASSLDDTYFYTDEYKTLSHLTPQRALLDDGINGAAGGRNTLHAAAVTGNTLVNLRTGQANLGGSPLTISHPHTIHNLISGDGNDTLIAHDAGAMLAAGRGHNTLRGGAGADLFVIQRRHQGEDILENFNAQQEDKILLVGFKGKSLADFTITQQAQDIHVALSESQSLLLKDQELEKIDIEQIIALQDSFTAPQAYVDSSSTARTLQENHSIIHLVGGEKGEKLARNHGQTVFSLTGTLYRHDRASSNHFVVMPQPGKLDYTNTVQGFKHGIDKIDVHHLGMNNFSSLHLEKVVRNKNGAYIVPIIHGVNILAKLGQEDSPAKILYLDGVEPAQVTESDFIFAEADKGIKQPELALWEQHISGLTNNLIHTLATANKEASICPIEDKYHTNDTALFYGHAPEHVSFTG
jgi:subtilisin-like proprotein convertase family protein